MAAMNLSPAPNQRVEWSPITDTSILRTGDWLTLLGANYQIEVAVLDSHNPRAEAVRQMEAQLPELLRAAGVIVNVDQVLEGTLGDHHHVLVKFPGSERVLSTGLYVGQGSPNQLFFSHVTVRYQANDPEYLRQLEELESFLGSSTLLGLFYRSDQEQISSTPAGQAYVRDDGGLIR
jgi:hypothetical protein